MRLKACISFFSILLFLASCEADTSFIDVTSKEYDGNTLEVSDLDAVYLDSGKVVMTLKAKEQWTLPNEDLHFPQGMDVAFYENEELSSTLHSLKATYYKVEHRWKFENDVEVKNVKTQEKLETQQLYWDERHETIKIDKGNHVTITSPDKRITGRGLQADQNFKEWEMDSVTAILYFDTDEIN